MHWEKEFLPYKKALSKYAPWVDIKKKIKLVKCLQAILCYSRLGREVVAMLLLPVARIYW